MGTPASVRVPVPPLVPAPPSTTVIPVLSRYGWLVTPSETWFRGPSAKDNHLRPQPTSRGNAFPARRRGFRPPGRGPGVTSTSQHQGGDQLATFHTGEKTHQAVLPQRPALESASADIPRNGNETGRGSHVRGAPGVEHVRGETTGGSPTAGGVAPVPPGAGEQAREDRPPKTTPREGHPYVFVPDRHGTPLQPTHPARARRLLARGRAIAARHTPFVIRLKDRTTAESGVDGVETGIGPGSKRTGTAVFTDRRGERRGRCAIRPDHRGGQIAKRMRQRAAYRKGRRSRNLRYRTARFDNRTRPRGWPPPSLRHRVDTTLAWVGRPARWAPVLERVAFDVHALGAGRPAEGVEYRHGTLHGYEVREYLLAKWGRACAYCGATGTPLNVDHVRPRSRGGSDRVADLALACVPCNRAKADQPVEEFVTNPRALAGISAQTKAPLRDAAAVDATRWALWRSLDECPPTRVGSGGRTKWNRTRDHLPESHTLDALAVGRVETVTTAVSTVLVVGAAGRGPYARTRADRHGFPRLRLPRRKRFFGFQTGDLARAAVPSDMNAGTHTGRVAVRSSGSHTLQTSYGPIKTSWKNLCLLQRADGYGYTTQKEAGAPSTA
ncbi:RNA-guided endonuclease IscB [Nocardiopsis sp. TNDT3]|uniref:RNA-guided endonuclease IscB n=1 Tax=Nocardiopsis TaxID=2013 RepID=UPI001E44D144|nr:RNA-guided endonuclease IscB [Nocardiopsis sp. TNDT3]